MTLPRRTRRRVDLLIAVGIAVVVAVVAVGIYLGSDVRATTLDPADATAAPTTPSAPAGPPQTLSAAWMLDTDPTYGAVASPYGTVVTADEHTVTGHDATTGKKVWSYTRSNRALCAIGSGDTRTDPLDEWTGVHGIMTLYAKNGYCSQVTLLDPSTGERLYQRTSPNEDPGQLLFGTPYVGWMGTDYLELWRHDLVATIRYGNQPNPVNANGPHTGCSFSDAAVTRLALATVEHCQDSNGHATVVLNWPTPDDAPGEDDKDWDANHSEPKATIDTGSHDAVIVGLTDDRIAVIVSDPHPALVVYDSAGAQISRTDIAVSAEEIAATAAAGITPSVTYDSRRYTLVGHHLIVTSSQPVTVTLPPATTTASASGAGTSGTGGTAATGSTTGTPEPSTTTEENPVRDWTVTEALGLPAHTGGSILVPTRAGYDVRSAGSGDSTGTIDVDRGSYDGRVDAFAVGDMIIESRGATVVGLR